MCTIKEKWESSSSNYQHTKSNILWEDWELSFCKLSVLIWAEDATRVCLVFRVALCGEKFSKKFIFWIIDAWHDAMTHNHHFFYHESTQTQYFCNQSEKLTIDMTQKLSNQMHQALLFLSFLRGNLVYLWYHEWWNLDYGQSWCHQWAAAASGHVR